MTSAELVQEGSIQMRKFTAVLFALVVVLALSTAVATAHNDKSHGSKAKKTTVYTGKLLGVTGVTGTTGTTGVTTVTGKVAAVQNKRNFSSTILLKGVNSLLVYTAHIHEDVDGSGCDSTGTNPVTITYKQKADDDGVANSNVHFKAKSKKIVTLNSTKDYYVEVHAADGTVVACGDLVAKKKGKSHKGKSEDKGKS